jgi:replicative DNA helicase
MTNVQLTKRLLASQCNMHGLRLKDGRLSSGDWDRLTFASGAMRTVPIYLSERPRLNALEISAMCRKLKRDTNGALKLIVVDYLGLMDHGDDNNRAASIERSTNALKNLAKELKTPVLLLSQVNRGCESRPNKRPIMSDLRESGGIEQDADTILFVYRDFVYSQNPDVREDAEVIVAKQRSGPIGTVRLRYDAPRTRFLDVEDRREAA